MTHRQILAVFSGLMAGLLLSALDQTIVSTALPTIVGELGGLSHYSWVVTVYLLSSTVSTPLYGKISDIYGRRAVFQAAILIFLVGSLLAGAAQDMLQLVLFRALQGVGGGGLLAMAFAIVGDVVSPRQRGRYTGYLGAVFAFASVVGPLVGGFIVDNFSWRWVFYINLPVGALALGVSASGLKLLPKGSRSHRVDYEGAALLVAGVSCLLLVLVWGARIPVGIADDPVAECCRPRSRRRVPPREARTPEPILPLRLFRQSIFSVCSALGFLGGCAGDDRRRRCRRVRLSSRRGRYRLGARELADHRLALRAVHVGVRRECADRGRRRDRAGWIADRAQIHGLQPFAFVTVAAVAVLAIWRRDHRVLAPLGVLGGVLLFVALAWVTERTLGWIRYSIAIVPLVSLMLALAVARLPVAETPTLWPGSSRRLLRVATAALAAVVLLAGYATTVDTWRDPDVGRTDLYVPGAWEKAGAVATYLDELGLRPGSVLMDNFFGYSVFARSERPTQFVVTSDRDFASVLADPVAAGVSRVVPRPSTALASLDAISRAYPGIYDDGAGIGTVVAEFDTHDHTPVWRVLAVTPAP